MAREDWLTYLYQRLQAIGAGWLYPYMVALVQRESSWRPDAIGTIAPGEYSIGLFQINMGSGLGPSRARAYFGTDDVEAARERLKDPYTNIDIAIRHFIQPALEGGAEDVAQILRPWGAGHLAIRDVQEGLAAQGPRGGKLARPALEEGEDMPEDEEGGTSAIERWVEENLPTAGTDSDLRARLRPVLGRPGIYFDPQTGAYYVMERVSTTTRIPLTNVEVPADIEAPRRLTASELETLGLRAPGPEAAPSPGAEYNRIVQAVQDGIITPEEGAQAIRRLTLGEEAAQLGPQPNQNIENILWAAQSGILSNEEAVAAIRSELLGAQASPNLGADFNRILFAASSGLISEEEAVTAIRRLVLGEPQAPMRPAVTYSDVGGLRQYFDAEGNLVGTRELREGEIARRPPKSYVDMGGVRFFLDEAGNLVDSIQIPEGEAAAVQPWTAMFRPARSFAELLAEAPGGDVRELGGDFATRSLVGAGHSGAISGMTGGGLPRSAEELEGLARARLQAPVGATPWQSLAAIGGLEMPPPGIYSAGIFPWERDPTTGQMRLGPTQIQQAARIASASAPSLAGQQPTQQAATQQAATQQPQANVPNPFYQPTLAEQYRQRQEDERRRREQEAQPQTAGSTPLVTAAQGFAGIVNRPTMFAVAEGGQPELVNIQPLAGLAGSSAGAGPGPLEAALRVLEENEVPPDLAERYARRVRPQLAKSKEKAKERSPSLEGVA